MGNEKEETFDWTKAESIPIGFTSSYLTLNTACACGAWQWNEDIMKYVNDSGETQNAGSAECENGCPFFLFIPDFVHESLRSIHKRQMDEKNSEGNEE